MRSIARQMWVVLAVAVLGACGPAGEATEGEAAAEARPQAPDFTLLDLDGNSVTLADLRGKVVVLDFWATWCPPCEYQIPILNEVNQAANEDVAILGISVDTEGAETVREYLETNPAEYPILMGSEALARRFGALGFPSLILVHPDGSLGDVHVGLIEALELQEAIAEAAALPGSAEPKS